MSEAAIFTREGEAFLPSADATGPWGADRLHGGPVQGLLARAIESAAPDPELVVTRLTFELFRPVPVQPLDIRVETLRQGRRLALLQAALLVGDSEFARATALLLRESGAPTSARAIAAPAGPGGLTTESLMRGFPRDDGAVPAGFHTRIETRWVPRSDKQPLAIWFRLPIPLVAGERASAFQCAAAISDFANAVAGIAARERDRTEVLYINADATLYLSRRPAGEWFCLREQDRDCERGISVAATLLCDTRGPCGRVLQAGLANR